MVARTLERATKAVLLIQSMCLLLIHSASQDVREYCTWDTFEATCGPNEVIMMKTARYGRMRLGRCVKKNFGYGGCAADVLTYMDRLCSGKRKCTLVIPDPTMRNMKPCSELEAYLEASYECVKVASGSEKACQSDHQLTLRGPSGQIPSVAADEKGYGTRSCPWIIQAKPGQRLNITLFDFGLPMRTSANDGSRFLSSLVCQRYAVLKETHSKSSTVCGGEARTKNIYVSDTNQVHVQVIPSRAPRDTTEFLLSYTVIGCADPTVSSGAEARRTGNTAEVTCVKTGEKWTLTCHGNSWRGQSGNCSEVDAWDIWQVLSDDWTSPHGILIVACLGIGLGVIIGVTLLAIALICMKRRRHKQDAEHMDGCAIPSDVDGQPRHDSMCTNDCSSVPLVKNCSRSKDGDYDYRWQQSRPLVPIPQDQIRAHGDKGDILEFPPPPYPNSTLYRQAGLSTFKPRDEQEHIYESPN